MNKLLVKQINKLIPEDLRNLPELSSFFDAVDSSYSSFERELDLSDRAFKLSEEEYENLNRQLTLELDVKRNSIKQLRDAVALAGDESWIKHLADDDLLGIAGILNKQIETINEAKKEQNRQKQFYERILNIIPADIAVIDKENRYLFVNPSAVKDAEIRKWMIGKTDMEYHIYRNKPLASAEKRLKNLEDVISRRQQQVIEEQFKTPSGETEHHLRILHPVYNDNGDFEVMVVYGLNITDRKKIEEKIQESELRYRSIFDYSQALICTHQLNGKIIDANRAAQSSFGYTLADITNMSVKDLVADQYKDDFDTLYLREIQETGKSEGIMVANSKEGKTIYLLYQNYLVKADTESPYVIGFSQDITARIKAERALKISEEKYRRIIENMNLGLLQVTPDEVIEYANQSFCEMSGYNSEELIGKKADTLFIIKDFDVNPVKERRKAGASDAYEIKAKTKDGTDKWWLISGAPIYNDNNEFTGSIGIHLDITQQKATEAEMHRAKLHAEASSRAKEAFLANMSHEIRTPMNAIIGISKLLSKTELQQQQRYYLSIVQNASNNLLVIINDLLDFSRIESGKVVLERVGFRMNDQLETTKNILQHKAEEKGLSFVCDCDGSISPVLIGDPYRLGQILVNLLGNAIKFTENGKVSVGCKVIEDTQTAQLLEFRIADTGIGISEEFIEYIFDKFSQEDESISRKFGGTGLGMSISKQLIELMGGNIAIESKKNAGTVMSFRIELDKGVDADLPHVLVADADTRSLKGKRILLVEDNATNRLLANNILKQHGADITEAEDGTVAIDLLKKAAFDMVLMDMQMPVMNGLDATRYIREHIDRSIPIIALTASVFKKEEEKCLEAGMNDFIGKPIDEDQMIRLIASWLGRDLALPYGNTKSPEREAARDLFVDLSIVASFAGNDKDFVNHISHTFAGELTESIEKMETAVAERNWPSLTALAHKIKPSTITFNVTPLVPVLESIESMNISNVNEDELKHKLLFLKENSQIFIQMLFEHLANPDK